MRIGICGASGAGKTTFANRLAKKLDIPLHSEPVRPWLEQKNLIFSQLNASQYAELQKHICDTYQKTLYSDFDNRKNYIFDRTPIDNIVFSKYPTKVHDADDIIAKNLSILHLFDMWLYFPPYSDWLVDDGGRNIDLQNQHLMASMVFQEIFILGQYSKTLVYDHCLSFDGNMNAIFEFYDSKLSK